MHSAALLLLAENTTVPVLGSSPWRLKDEQEVNTETETVP
jgi:hypothetical protein